MFQSLGNTFKIFPKPVLYFDGFSITIAFKFSAIYTNNYTNNTMSG